MASTDFLIRSATSLLSIIDQQVEKPRTSSEDRSVRFLDRIALLFVSKSKHDISAVSAVLGAKSSVLVVCTESSATDSPPSEDVIAEYLLVSKNSPVVKVCHGPYVPLPAESPHCEPSVDLVFPTAMIGEDWLLKCCQNGPMGSAEHAAQIQYLLLQIRCKGTTTAATNLTRFIYYQCYPKVLQRLCLLVSEGGVSFKDVFLSGTIDLVDLRSRSCFAGYESVLDEKIVRHGDVWITVLWNKTFGKPPAFQERNGKLYLIYNGATAVKLHKLIGHVFRLLFVALDQVRHGRQFSSTSNVLTGAYIVELKVSLDAVSYYMDVLARLVKSPCFWIHLQHPDLKAWVSNQHSAGPKPKPERFFDNDDEEVVETQDQAAEDPVGAVARWLRCASQWSVSLSEIIQPNSRSTRILLSREVKILSLKVPTVIDPHKQSCLEDLLCYVAEGSPFDWTSAVKTLQKVAHAKVSSKEPGETGWQLLTSDQWNNWESSFTGKHHCESVLASLLEMKATEGVLGIVEIAQRAKKAIGVSKRCCFCCALYLRHLNPQLSFGATSGKAYPWALPPWCQGDRVGEIILQKLTERLQQRLVDLGTPGRKSWDSGSDSGRSDEEDTSEVFSVPFPPRHERLPDSE